MTVRSRRARPALALRTALSCSNDGARKLPVRVLWVEFEDPPLKTRSSAPTLFPARGADPRRGAAALSARIPDQDRRGNAHGGAELVVSGVSVGCPRVDGG